MDYEIASPNEQGTLTRMLYKQPILRAFWHVRRQGNKHASSIL